MEEKPRVFSPPITVEAGRRLAFRLYPDHRPGNLEIAPLQKGLVLVLDGVELVEEGIGFGVPVVKYADKTYFAGTAETSMHKSSGAFILRKVFVLDTVSKKQVWRGPFINDRFYSLMHGAFAKVYIGHKKARPASDKVMQLRRAFGVHTRFVKVKPRGKIQITYHCSPNEVDIDAQMLTLQRSKCEEILILNEQGASFFRRYADEDGELLDADIGAWERVKTNEAALSDIKKSLTFMLTKPQDANLYRGWERVKGRLSWVGLSYSLKPSITEFRYTIKLSGSL